jgi:autotransporter-associated beta strand protein
LVSALRIAKFVFVAGCIAAAWSWAATAAQAQRAFGVDVSYWQGEITQQAWNYSYNNDDRVFAFVRATRGGTTGLGQTSGTPGGGSQETLSRRYDDPRFIQNMVRANNAGLMTGPYHFARPDIAGNTGVDEANHFMQMAGIYMRPGYMLPMYDLEAGQAETTPQQLAQFSLDFSDRIYEVMKIRPSIYANGNYMNDLAGATSRTQNQIAQPSPNAPSMVSPAFPVLFAARYAAGSGNPYNEAVHGSLQTQNPKDAGGTLSWFFGPFDNYGNSQPWHFWQYSSGEAPFGSFGDTTTDGDVSQGDIEFVRDTLVPAVWWSETSGDWSTLANWNSGQPVSTPVPGPGQASPYANGPLPVPRLPGAAGSGPTSGQYDTVILEVPTANVTVTVSTGSHNIRKLYMREALNITGGSLTINYNPNYSNDFDNNPNTNFPGALRSGPISAQFSGPVSLSGAGSLSVHTLQIDPAQTFTLGGGTITFDKINLMSNASTKVSVTGNVNINPLNNATATITRSASSGVVDLNGGMPQITVGNGAADVDLSVAVPITNGGFIKAGAGTMRLDGVNTFAGNVTVDGGMLRYGHASGLSNNAFLTVNNGAQLDMNGVSDTIAGLASAPGHTSGVVQQGAASLTLSGMSGDYTYYGSITGTGTFNKSGGSIARLDGNNTFGAVNLNAGSLVLNGSNTTGTVTVNGGTLAGSGYVSGPVVLNSSAHLSPGTGPASFTAGALTLNTGSILDIDLGPAGMGDLVAVNGQLTLNGGSINVLNETLTMGFYPLIYYGSLAGGVANLSLIGPAGFDYQLVDSGGSIGLLVLPAGIPGDFNDDGMVDSADYLILKKFNGTDAELPNDGGLTGTVGEDHYNLWQQNFGRYTGDGGGGQGQVPEPAAAILAALGLIGCLGARRRRDR